MSAENELVNQLTFSELVSGLDFSGNPTDEQKQGGYVTIRLPDDFKERYDQLQKQCERQFTSKCRRALIELIKAAEVRAAQARAS